MTFSKFLIFIVFTTCMLSTFASCKTDECYMDYSIDLRRNSLCFSGISRIPCWRKYDLARTVEYVEYGFCYNVDNMMTPCHYVPVPPPVDLEATYCMDKVEDSIVECEDPRANICIGHYVDQYDQRLEVKLKC
jgi:hypothetical protein